MSMMKILVCMASAIALLVCALDYYILLDRRPAVANNGDDIDASGSSCQNEMFTCQDEAIGRFTQARVLGQGLAKMVSLVRVANYSSCETEFVVQKSINYGGRERTHAESLERERLLLMEANHLRSLRSEHVIELLGSCLIGSRGRFHFWTEFMARGEFNPHQYRGEPIERRLSMCRDVAAIMHFLNVSPIGSVLMMDFKTSQFLVDSRYRVRLSDVDTVRAVPHGGALDRGKACSDDSQCTTYSFRSPEWACNATVGQCVGYSHLSNMYHSCRLFFTPLLADTDAALPQSARNAIATMLELGEQAQLSATHALDLLDSVASQIQRKTTTDIY
jgi:Protein-kinase domain of FAM69